MSLSWDLTKLLKCFPFSVLNSLPSCCAAAQVTYITMFCNRRGIFSSACLARKHEIPFVRASLQLYLNASYAKLGLNCKEQFFLNLCSVIWILSLLVAEDKQQNRRE